MTRQALLNRWLEGDVLTGRLALLLALAVVAVPTAIRVGVDGVVTGIAVTPYFPFMMLAAILLAWWAAGLVALVSATIADILFIGPPNQFLETPTDLFAVGMFLLGSGLMIGFVALVRRAAELHRNGRKDAPSSGIVFSLEKGEAWASWYERPLKVRLGQQEEVAAMMEDFLAQLELAKRLESARYRATGL